MRVRLCGLQRWSHRRPSIHEELEMTLRFISIGAALALVLTLAGPVFAGAKDYVFEPIKAEVKKGDDAVVSVRLKHKATGKPVTDAVIIQTRIDVAPDGVGAEASALPAVPSSEPGVEGVKTQRRTEGP